MVDYTREDFAREARRYDVVVDLVANRSLTDLRRTLAPAGTLVLSGGGTFEGGSLVGPMGLIIKAGLVARFVRHRIVLLRAAPSGLHLVALTELIDARSVRPVVERTYPLTDAAEAIRYVESEHPRAKVVVSTPSRTGSEGFCIPRRHCQRPRRPAAVVHDGWSDADAAQAAVGMSGCPVRHPGGQADLYPNRYPSCTDSAHCLRLGHSSRPGFTAHLARRFAVTIGPPESPCGNANSFSLGRRFESCRAR